MAKRYHGAQPGSYRGYRQLWPPRVSTDLTDELDPSRAVTTRAMPRTHRNAAGVLVQSFDQRHHTPFDMFIEKSDDS